MRARARGGGAGGSRAGEALTVVRIGIFGGTFDPPHVGHLLAASDAHEALALDRLLFVPAARQPFKGDAVGASPAQRAAMLELMLAGDARFAVDRSEMEREGLSYTVDTLAGLAARHPGASLHLLIGEDLSAQIATWREPARIAALAEIVVLARAGDRMLAPRSDLPMRRLDTRRVDVSSTEIRARVKGGTSINGFVVEPVARFIRDAGLYR